MISEIKKYFTKRKIKKLIVNITEAIYSEEYRYDDLIVEFSDKNNLLSNLQCNIAIRVASESNESISNDIINNATEDYLTASESILNRKIFDEISKTHKDLAEICFLEKMIAILERKQIYDTDKYTYEGLVYAVERNRKGPSSITERERYRKLANDYKEAVLKYEELVKDDEEASKRAFQEYFDKLKIEVAEDIKKNGPKSAKELDMEYEDLMRQLLKSLNEKNQ